MNEQLPVQETKLFVGNLPQNITADELRPKFDIFGPVTDIHIMNKPSVRNNAVCAFVRFENMEDCQKAVAATDKILMFEGCSDPCVVRLKNVSFDKGAKGTQVSLPAGQGNKRGNKDNHQQDNNDGKGRGKGGNNNWQEPNQYAGPVDHGWTEHKAPDGRAYFYNSKSGASTWERPMELNQPPMPSGPAPMLPGWDEFRAPDGRAYFYNAHTGESVWERPVDHAAAAHQQQFSGYNQGGGGNNFQRYGAAQNSRQAQGALPKIFIGDLPSWVEKEHLQALCQNYGQIIHIHVMQGSSSANKCAFVEFSDMSMASVAIDGLDQNIPWKTEEIPLAFVSPAHLDRSRCSVLPLTRLVE